jgi:hypothetical protein
MTDVLRNGGGAEPFEKRDAESVHAKRPEMPLPVRAGGT